jgi:hypothetical protein
LEIEFGGGSGRGALGGTGNEINANCTIR